VTTTLPVGVIIPAAGRGSRMGGSLPKQFLELDGRPILVRTLGVFLELPEITRVVVPVAADRFAEAAALLKGFFPEEMGSRLRLVRGGSSRQLSVRAGLAALPADIEVVLVHDGARPLVTPQIIRACLRRAVDGAVITAVEIRDTLKRVSASRVRETIDRSHIHAAQTPQGAPRSLFIRAFERAEADNFHGTDEASLFEHAALPVAVVPGSEENIKITRPGDLELALAIIAGRRAAAGAGTGERMKIGHGFDAHRLVRDRNLILGGVKIDHELGLLGHSDADVLTHALMDAILGALGCGDIGHHFPDSDPDLKDIDSLTLLARVMEMAAGQGYEIANCDMTLVCQRPRLAPLLPKMRENLAAVCGISPDGINIKATTTEKMGPFGRGEGIGAHAVVLLRRC